jgi:hypothetical protein
VASRKASQIALEAFTAALPELLGGSADLTGSNLTNTKSTPALRVDLAGEVVERPKTADRPPHQLRRARIRHGRHHERRGAARRLHPLRRHLPDLQRLQPQRHPHGRADEAARDPRLHARLHRPGRRRPHAPVHRARRQPAPDPGLDVWRPADTAETAVAWAVALQNKTSPTALLLSRQNLPYAPKTDLGHQPRRLCAGRAGRVGLKKKAQAVIIATGSEVQLALQAQALLAERKIAVRVVSMPSTTLRPPDVAYKAEVLPTGPAAHRGGNGRDRRLVEIRLRRRGRHRHLRRIGAGAGAVQAFRLHARERGRHRAGRADQEVQARAAPRDSFSVLTLEKTHDHQDWHQRLRPHRPQRVPRAVQNFADIEVVGINDLLEPDYLAYMLQVRQRARPLQGHVSVEGNTLIVNGKKIRLTQERDPANLKWNEVGADIVIESTGLFLDKAGAKSTWPPAPRRSSVSALPRTTRPCSSMA